MPRVILASASPRRQELLRQLVPSFEVVPANVNEEALTVSDPASTAASLAQHKAAAVFALYPDAVVIGGDTVVAVEQGGGSVQLAKPRDAENAERMLRLLSAREHVVITGISVVAPGVSKSEAVTTAVRFRHVTQQEIADYVATGEPMDKAGAYAIQGGAAGFVEGIEGSWSNVVGLPLERLGPMLEDVLRSLAPH